MTESGRSTATLVVEPEVYAGDVVDVHGASYHHLFRARRLPVGSRVRVVDGAGRARWSEVVHVERAAARLKLDQEAPANEPDWQLTLAVPTLRPERASWLVEKATELGVRAIHWYRSERSPRDFGSGTLERLRRVAVAATEQCGRSRVPEVTGVDPWSELLTLAGAVTPYYGLDPRAADPWTAVLPPPRWVAVGPEGGFTGAERSELERAGGRWLGLGPRILRIETAAVVAVARSIGPD